MANQSKKKNISIQKVLAALLDDKNIFPPAYLRHFSDLEDADLAALRSVWPQVNPNRRFTLLEDLEETAENDTLVLFDAVAIMALEDDDPRVRTVAIRLLWESENEKLINVFQKMLKSDPNVDVRAAAATALGQFIYLGELEEIPDNVLHQVEETLLRVVSGTDEDLVRRRALEALGFSGRDEVPALIRKAYESNSQDWLISALFAMGRSANNIWQPEVLRYLRHSQTAVQMEAVKAAGELELEAARRPMLMLLNDELIDSELRDSIYWALSKIGGEDVRETLEMRLEETEDDEEAEFLENALENLDFTDEMNMLELMEFDDLPLDGETPEEFLERHDARLVDLEESENEHESSEETTFDVNSSEKPSQSKPEKTTRKRHKPHNSD